MGHPVLWHPFFVLRVSLLDNPTLYDETVKDGAPGFCGTRFLCLRVLSVPVVALLRGDVHFGSPKGTSFGLASPVESVKVTLLLSVVLMVLSVMVQFFALAMGPAVVGSMFR